MREAMASELPVIAPRSGGMLAHVVDGEKGLLWNPEAFIHTIQALLQNPHLGPELGRQGRAHAAPRSWEHIFDRLLDNYAEAAARWQREPSCIIFLPMHV